MSATRIFRALVLALMLLMLGAAIPMPGLAQPCAPDDPCAFGEPLRPPVTEHFSAAGFAHQLGRGLANATLFWLEIPYQIKSHLATTCPIPEWGPFTSTVYFVNGAVSGVLEGAFRGVTGVYEIVLSPFPPYNPVNCPSWPPYVGPRPPVVKVVAEAPEP